METAKKIEERKEKKNRLNNSRTRKAKKEAQKEYVGIHEEVKKSITQDKRRYIDNLTQQAVEAVGKRNMKQVYNIARRLAGRPKVADRPVKDKNGTVLTNQSD